MEFYFSAFIKVICSLDCFNSQRDGILQDLALRLRLLARVLIPNGMEFYLAFAASRRRKYHVLIPNGMEFYIRGLARP